MDGNTKIAVIGGRISSLACAMKLAEMGIAVDIFAPQPVERYAPSGSDGLTIADDPSDPSDSMEILSLLIHLGVPFDRTSEGKIDFKTSSSEHLRTACAGDETGWHIHRILCDQAQRWEAAGRIPKHEYREVVDFIIDSSGACRGIVALDLKSMEVSAHQYDAVILAVAGPMMSFGESPCVSDDFGPMVLAYLKGAQWINPHDTHGGGLRVDGNYQTDIPGIYAIGECAYSGEEAGLAGGISSGFACAKSVGASFGGTGNLFDGLEPNNLENYCEASRMKLFGVRNETGDASRPGRGQATAFSLCWDLAGLMRRTAAAGWSMESLADARRILAEEIIPALNNLFVSVETGFADREILQVHRLGLLVPASLTVLAARETALTIAGDRVTIAAEWSDGKPNILTI